MRAKGKHILISVIISYNFLGENTVNFRKASMLIKFTLILASKFIVSPLRFVRYAAFVLRFEASATSLVTCYSIIVNGVFKRSRLCHLLTCSKSYWSDNGKFCSFSWTEFLRMVVQLTVNLGLSEGSSVWRNGWPITVEVEPCGNWVDLKNYQYDRNIILLLPGDNEWTNKE
jgi:hypothetical protein